VARVLVVEDNADAGDAMRMLLEAGGHDVRVAGTVAAAIAACNETGWDEPAVIARCRAAGCRDVLLKPVSARTLLALTATLTT
jgi:CheY-like chemotaxis protein